MFNNVAYYRQQLHRVREAVNSGEIDNLSIATGRHVFSLGDDYTRRIRTQLESEGLLVKSGRTYAVA